MVDNQVVQRVQFPCGLPGFPGLRFLDLQALSDGLWRLSDQSLQFILVEAAAFADMGQLVIEQQQLDTLGLSDGQQPLVLVMLTLDPVGGATGNLMGPVVVNQASGVALQIIRDDYPSRAPLPMADGRGDD